MEPVEKRAPIYVGCAGWNIPKTCDSRFCSEGTHLERYGSHFNGVEINSSFYRSHKAQTYGRWATSVPKGFRFAVKMPKTITHENRLRDVAIPLQSFVEQIAGLGDKLGPLLIQLPPSLEFDGVVMERFFSLLRSLFDGEVVCEPRHRSWFKPNADELLRCNRIARVAADPAIVADAFLPGGFKGLTYYRLHGSPRMYYSSYSQEVLALLAMALRDHVAQGTAAWCIFDNTAVGAAMGNAMEMTESIPNAKTLKRLDSSKLNPNLFPPQPAR